MTTNETKDVVLSCPLCVQDNASLRDACNNLLQKHFDFFCDQIRFVVVRRTAVKERLRRELSSNVSLEISYKSAVGASS
jgi:hypothetical protein